MNRINFAVFFLSLFLLAGCGDEVPQKVNALISTANNGAIIQSRPSPRPDKPQMVLLSPELLPRFRDMVGKKATEAFKCGYDGVVQFKKGEEELLSIQYNLDKACRHISFMFEGESRFYEINPEAAEFLGSIQPEPARLEEVSWMLGKWYQEEGEIVSYEEWTRKNDQEFEGKAWSVKGSDMTFTESLTVKEENGVLVYIADVSQNAGPVPFSSTYLKGERVMFENRAHDFPQIIIYQKRGQDTLHARIEGLANGTPFGKDFYLIRSEK